MQGILEAIHLDTACGETLQNEPIVGSHEHRRPPLPSHMVEELDDTEAILCI